MASKPLQPKSLNTSKEESLIEQLSLWKLLTEATNVPLMANLEQLYLSLDLLLTNLSMASAIEQQISVAGEGLMQIGKIIALRAEIRLEEISYLLNPDQEPVMPLNAFDCYVRQTMIVDFDQFCATPELPKVTRGYTYQPVTEPIDEEEAIAQILAAVHQVESNELLNLNHSEDILDWSAIIRDCLIGNKGRMEFWSIVQATGLAPVEVLLGLLFGELPIRWTVEGDFYLRKIITLFESP
jgi:hypothetical protein